MAQQPSTAPAVSTSSSNVTTPRNPNSKVQFDAPDDDEKSGGPSSGQLLSSRGKRRTSLHHVESRFVPHKYLIRRPRALQVEYHGKMIEVGDSGKVNVADLDNLEALEASRTTSATSDASSSAESSDRAQERSTDNVDKQRERLDLFVDLVWVGIISNLSENFFTQSFAPHVTRGDAIAVFIVLFVPSWQLWSKLQLFLNNYYMDDLLQRMIILWYLVLAILWGNVAPYAVPDGSGTVQQNERTTHLLAIYLVANGTLLITEVVYSYFMPWNRRMLYWGFVFNIPAYGLWTAAICTIGFVRLGLLWGAIGYERIWSMLISSPMSDRLFGDGFKKTHDPKHIRKRYESFFIIALGEGVFLLIRKSPLGDNISVMFARGIMSLMIYYALHTIYFSGDQAKLSVHAIHRRWWIRHLWQFLHLPLFASLVLLSSGLLYLVDYSPEGETNGIPPDVAGGESIVTGRAESSGEPLSTSNVTLQTAIGTCCTCMAIVLLVTLIVAFLAKPLDEPKTLIVNNRYIRLAPRMAAIIVLATMWLAYFENATAAIGWMGLVVWVVMVWEWHAGMERGGGIFEPKHAT